MKPGIYDLPNKEYHQKSAMNCSGLKELIRSPAHYQHWLTADRFPTDAMKIGTALHTLVLEPYNFDAEIAVEPGADAPKKPTKPQLAAEKKSDKAIKSIEFWDSYEKSVEGKIVISQKAEVTVRGMADAVKDHPKAKELLSAGRPELSVFAQDPKYDFLWKVRPDWITQAGVIIDLKSCEDASPEGFQRQVESFSYHLQAALYMRVMSWVTGIEHKHFLLLAVEKKPPHCIGIYTLDFRSIDGANLKIDRARRLFAKCNKTGKWPGYDNEINTIGVRRWSL